MLCPIIVQGGSVIPISLNIDTFVHQLRKTGPESIVHPVSIPHCQQCRSFWCDKLILKVAFHHYTSSCEISAESAKNREKLPSFYNP